MRLLKRLSILLSVVVVLVISTWMHDRYAVPIITYHNISANKTSAPLNNVSPASFDRQMKFIKDFGYNVISFDELVTGYIKGVNFPHNTVVVHFDDGYEDNFTEAFPILKKYDLPAMVFLVSDKIGTPGYVNWDQVKEMEANRFMAGAHTRNHVYLPDAAPDVAQDEIAGSKRVIEEKLGHSIDYFVYPSGGFSLEVKDLVKKAGYKAAASTNRGRDRFNKDLFELKRVRSKDGDGGFVLWAKLSGYYNLFRKAKDGY